MDSNIKAVRKILFHIERIERAFQNVTYEELLDSELLQDAGIANIEQLGENVKFIDEDFRKKYSNVEWQKMKSTRNLFVHNYEGIDFKIMWQMIKVFVPDLKEKLLSILDDAE